LEVAVERARSHVFNIINDCRTTSGPELSIRYLNSQLKRYFKIQIKINSKKKIENSGFVRAINSLVLYLPRKLEKGSN